MTTRTATTTTATTRVAALTLGLLSLTTASANAAPDAGPMIRVAETSTSCPLTRVGTQYVRCDDLTGNGVPAPSWIATGPGGAADLGAIELASATSATASDGSAADSLEWRRLGL